jgi:hypothetical protein
MAEQAPVSPPPAVVVPAERITAAPVLLAQYSDNSNSGSNTRISGRGARGLVKLVIFGGILLFSGVAWVFRKVVGS